MGKLNSKLITNYWKKKLSQKDFVLELSSANDKIKEFSSIISNEKLVYFDKLTKGNSVAKFTVLFAIYSFLLERTIIEFDGFVVLNYENKDTLVSFLSPDLNLSFKEYVQKVKEEILETLNYSKYDKSSLEKEIGCSDLDVMSYYAISFNSDTKPELKGVLFDLNIVDGKGIQITTYYFERFINESIINCLTKRFEVFLANLEENINKVLAQFSLVDDREKEYLLYKFNDTTIEFPSTKTMIDLFEEQVSKTPNNAALTFKENMLTYSDLNKKVNQFARIISYKYGIGKGEVVGVCLPKSDIGIFSFLAILKLGAIYLPIDIDYPKERINYIIKDSGLKFVISNDDIDFFEKDVQIINFNQVNLKDVDDKNLHKLISSTDLAYIIYTSGTTGNPKGVMIEHTCNVNMSLDQVKSFNITSHDKVVWFASVSFDASISEIMMCFYSGASLSIPTEETIKDKIHFIDFLRKTESTVVTFPPSYLSLLSNDSISGLRCIITAGESPNSTRAIEIVKKGIEYYNAYGPTEYSVCATIYKVLKNDINKSIIPIGSPISNTQIYILDQNLQLLPIGVEGKIYISGIGLARGYLKKLELTTEKFIPNPFKSGHLMYDSGDLGRWLPDGNIEFVGRKDSQVKIRGHRIELEEIENTVLKFSSIIQQVVVQVKDDKNFDKVLVAYYLSDSNVNKKDLRAFLQKKLPSYMLPNFYIAIDKLPLTPNGKIDKKALPNVTEKDLINNEYVSPNSDTEKVLVEIWQDILGVEKVGVTDNFFELGGHSLKITKMLYQINNIFEIELRVKNILAIQNIRDLAHFIEGEVVFAKGIATVNETSEVIDNKHSDVWEI